MRIVRFGEPGRELPGVLTPEGRLLDATSLVADWTAEHLDPRSDAWAAVRDWLSMTA